MENDVQVIVTYFTTRAFYILNHFAMIKRFSRFFFSFYRFNLFSINYALPLYIIILHHTETVNTFSMSFKIYLNC